MLANFVEGGHTGLQNYVVNQTLGESHHEESYNLIEASVTFLNEVENKLRESVGLYDPDKLMLQKRGVYIDVLITGLDFLENLAKGPHHGEQKCRSYR
eukprot:SAG31_NODE_845_length_11547_cov_8.098096_2_plen_98_part_00